MLVMIWGLGLFLLRELRMISEKVAISFGEETENEMYGTCLADRVEDVLADYGFVRYGGSITMDGKRRTRDYNRSTGKVSVIFTDGPGVVSLVQDAKVVVKAPVFVEFHSLEEGLVGLICDDLAKAEA